MPDSNYTAVGQDAPIVATLAVTPHDTNPIADLPRALWIGVGGDVALKASGDSVTAVFKNVPSGSVLAVRVKVLLATGTTATDIVALY